MNSPFKHFFSFDAVFTEENDRNNEDETSHDAGNQDNDCDVMWQAVRANHGRHLVNREKTTYH